MMQAYEEDLDEEAGYDDYYSDDNGLDEYEEEEEEVPPKEEVEYLELRQRIKESIRKKSGSGGVTAAQSSQDRRKKQLPYNDFGSFFGPSRPVISSRVIQESKSLLENEIKNSNQPKKRPVPASSSGDKNVSHEKKRPKVLSATRRKVETLKDTRDYSFLFSDDAELPAPKKEPLSRSGSFPNSESRSARPKQSPAINGRVAQGPPPREDKRPVVSANGHSRPASSGGQMNHSRPTATASSGSQMQSKSVSGRPTASSGSSQMQKSRPVSSGNQMQQRAASSGSQRPGSSTNRQAPMRPPGSTMNGQSANRNGQPSSRSEHQRPAPGKVPVDHRRQMSNSSSNGVGPGRSGSTARPLPSKPSLERKPSIISAGKSSLQSAQRPTSSSRPMSSDPRQRLGEQRKVNPTASRIIPKQPVPTSRHQMMSKPAAKRPPQRDIHDDRRPLKKKKPSIMSEDAKALSMIRQMFNTNRYAGRDDDDRNMEANFDDIMKEERRSARIAREEDEKEAQLIAQEEERERLRKIRKNR
ncbi:PREDICTED: serine/arginine repetitive matrix protein 2-like isoform X2 [Brassica oleracea var. oleracea]|uniref:serine/arginine repetitive matrix protein 2-like isoform X2 n=1 Tax=Brassica oleracea var. oleracea TaxID=109376 RepID=UPI0006A70A58|nr:PREDICTED: serine/arginine repetitive matrix protein 2-like isoform X2 [Brassica oleracea var. oleracea]